MSLGDYTKCHLDASKATIDREKLLKALTNYVVMLRSRIDSEVSLDYTENVENNSISWVAWNSKNLIRLTDNLSVAYELLHVVNHLETREEVIWR